jgi:hypothetical protein
MFKAIAYLVSSEPSSSVLVQRRKRARERRSFGSLLININKAAILGGTGIPTWR